MKLTDVLIRVDGREITAEDVLVFLKANGIFRNTVCQLVELEVMKRRAADLGIGRDESAFEEYCHRKRRYWGILPTAAMHDFCRKNGITLEQWLEATRLEYIRDSVRGHVVSEEEVQAFFEKHREGLRTVTISRIVCEDEAAARKVLARAEAGEPFADLARECSREGSTRVAGGYLGTVRRGALAPAVEAPVFAASAGEIVGPLFENGYWTLYRIDGIREPVLDETLRRDISDRLFRRWLQAAIGEVDFRRQPAEA
jgi:hypothetical protein